MYRLLSAHLLGLIDDSVISIERYIVVQRCSVPLTYSALILSLNVVTSTVDTQVTYVRTSLTKCLLLGIRVTAVDKDIHFTL